MYCHVSFYMRKKTINKTSQLQCSQRQMGVLPLILKQNNFNKQTLYPRKDYN